MRSLHIIYLAFLHHRDDFCRPDSSLSSSFAPQGLLCPGRIHPYPALLLHRDYFRRSDSSLPCSFAPQRLFPPVGCISILFFFTTGMISAARMHLYLALLLHRDDFHRPNASLSCSFAPQGLFCPGRMYLYLALFFHRDDFAPVGCVPSLRTSLPGHSVNFRKTPESMFFNLSYATLDALRKQSFLRLSAAFAAYSPSHNGAFVSKLPQHLMLGLCVAHC